MCGRFFFTATPKEVSDLTAVYELDAFPPRYNIAPTQPILMIGQGARAKPGSNVPERKALLVRWGLIPSWVKDVKKFPLLINARSETISEKNSFKAAVRYRRMLIPASGFYEWRRTDDKQLQAYMVRPRNGAIVAFAGLYETYMAPDGSEIDTGAIVTTQSNAAFMPIHDRMPVVVRPENFERWLDCATFEPREVTDLFAAVGDAYFEAVPISNKVNRTANMNPEIQNPLVSGQEPDVPKQKIVKSVKSDSQMKLF